jgi:hypothetical protein
MVKILAALAILQGALGILRALHWFHIGADLGRGGLLLLPILGVVTAARGTLVGLIALLYVLFAWGILSGKSWARGVGLAACVLNLLAALGLLLYGDSLAAAFFWAVVPLIVGTVLLRARPPAPSR